MPPRSPESLLNEGFREEGYIRELRSEDMLAISQLEQEAYADNPALIQEDAGVGRQIATAETRQTEGKPTLSMKFEKDGTLYGYYIAYEAEYKRNDGLLPPGAPYVYLADFAVRDQKTLSGSRVAILLMSAMLKKYKNVYLDANNPLPIITIMREHTSRQLLHDALPRVQKSLGVHFTVSETNQFEKGDDTMYRTLITVQK